MHTELYCTNLDDLDNVKAIRAIHQAYLQLKATKELVEEDGFDNETAMNALEKCLSEVGHKTFVSVESGADTQTCYETVRTRCSRPLARLGTLTMMFLSEEE